MGTVAETFKSNFIEYEFTVDFEETSTRYLFDKKDFTPEQVDILADTFNTLYDNEIVTSSFDEYLETMGISFYTMGENKRTFK